MRLPSAIFLFALFLFVNVGSASAQIVEFRGTFIITKLNNTCSNEGWILGEISTTGFRPGGVGSNGSTGLSIFYPFFSEGYRYSGPVEDLTQGDFLNVAGAGVWGNGPFNISAKLKLTSVKPLPILPTTNFVTLVGQFKDFDVPGCNISFRMTANRSF